MKDIHSLYLGKRHPIGCIYTFYGKCNSITTYELRLCIYIVGNNGDFWTITGAALGGTYVSTLVFILLILLSFRSI